MDNAKVDPSGVDHRPSATIDELSRFRRALLDHLGDSPSAEVVSASDEWAALDSLGILELMLATEELADCPVNASVSPPRELTLSSTFAYFKTMVSIRKAR